MTGCWLEMYPGGMCQLVLLFNSSCEFWKDAYNLPCIHSSLCSLPCSMFVNMVRRLRITRGSEATGLGRSSCTIIQFVSNYDFSRENGLID